MTNGDIGPEHSIQRAGDRSFAVSLKTHFGSFPKKCRSCAVVQGFGLSQVRILSLSARGKPIGEIEMRYRAVEDGQKIPVEIAVVWAAPGVNEDALRNAAKISIEGKR
jgi:hypothetical protein